MEMHNAFNQQYGYRPHMSPSPNMIPSQSSQRFSPLNALDIKDDEFAPLFGKGPSQPVVQGSPDESLKFFREEQHRIIDHKRHKEGKLSQVFREEQHREDDPIRSEENRLQVIRDINDSDAYLSLKADLVEHIWRREDEH
nr:hypothetical protein [Tanacetum cinerariifolium]